MPIDSLTTLKEKMRAYMKRRTINEEDLFVQLAEERIVDGFGDEKDDLFTGPVRVRSMESSTTITIKENENSGQLPEGFLGFRGPLYVGSGKLVYIPPSVYRDRQTQTKTPYEYTVIGNNILTYPTADQDYAIGADIYSLPPLSVTNLSNNLLIDHPNIYLYVCLLEACIFYKKDSDTLKYHRLFKGAVHAANRQDEMSRFSGGTLEMQTSYTCY